MILTNAYSVKNKDESKEGQVEIVQRTEKSKV